MCSSIPTKQGFVKGADVARPIEDVLADLAADVPAEEWDRLPTDLTENLDHYLYDAPKVADED